MPTSHPPGQAASRNARALRLLEELPGVPDVVWTIVARLGGRPSAATVLFTAPERGAGTTVVAAATALGLVLHERVPVCLVETTIGRPALARRLGLEGPGLAEVLSGAAALDDCLVELPDCSGLFVLTAGAAAPRHRMPQPGAFTTPAFADALARLRARCHYLVLDAAPVTSAVEARRLAEHADGAVLVVRARSSRRSDAERSIDLLAESGTLLLGTVFNADVESSAGVSLSEVRRDYARAVRLPTARTAVEIAPPHPVRERTSAAANTAANTARSSAGASSWPHRNGAVNGADGGAADERYHGAASGLSNAASNGAVNGVPPLILESTPPDTVDAIDDTVDAIDDTATDTATDTSTDTSTDTDTNGAAHTNGAAEPEVVLTPHTAAEAAVDDESLPIETRAEIDRLLRRVAKLSRRLEETERRLDELAAAQVSDQGLASLERRDRVSSALAQARSSKALLMQAIFQANVELKQALAVEA